jgi:TPR repeat protein
MLKRAAEAGNPRAALALGATYDPDMLRKMGVLGFAPDVAQARAWYERAAALGSGEASRRLAALR